MSDLSKAERKALARAQRDAEAAITAAEAACVTAAAAEAVATAEAVADAICAAAAAAAPSDTAATLRARALKAHETRKALKAEAALFSVNLEAVKAALSGLSAFQAEAVCKAAKAALYGGADSSGCYRDLILYDLKPSTKVEVMLNSKRVEALYHGRNANAQRASAGWADVMFHGVKFSARVIGPVEAATAEAEAL
jgi:hypothetical protein